MDLLPSPTQIDTIDAIASYLREKLPVARYQAFSYDCLDTPGSAVKEVAALGWFGFALDEALGGSGGALTDEMLMMREVGRHVAPLWIPGGVLGARIAALAGKQELAAALLEGRASVAIATASGERPASTTTRSGRIHVIGAERAQYAVLVDVEGALLLDLSRLRLQPAPCIERQLSLHHAELADGSVVAAVPVAKDNLFVRQTILMAAMQAGNCEATRDMAVEYAKVREQFGRPIGSFQAISHMCVDMALRCEQAWTQLSYACLAFEEGAPDAAFQVAAAAVLANRSAIDNARANLQVHGGIGMTQAHSVNYFLKRSHVVETLTGGSFMHLDAIMDTAGAAQNAGPVVVGA